MGVIPLPAMPQVTLRPKKLYDSYFATCADYRSIILFLSRNFGLVATPCQCDSFVTAGTIGLIDEYVMRLLPAKIDPAIPGGFTAS